MILLKKNKETLKYLKEKYPNFFEINNKITRYDCKDECYIDKLANVDLSNKVKAVMDKYLDLFSENQLKEFKENDIPTNYIFLPEDDTITYSSMVGVTSLDYGDKDCILFIYLLII